MIVRRHPHTDPAVAIPREAAGQAAVIGIGTASPPPDYTKGSSMRALFVILLLFLLSAFIVFITVGLLHR